MRLPAKIEPEQITALVDSREQKPLDLAPLRIETATLTTGDYSVKGLENMVAIERKSEADLLVCIGRERERFDREIQRLLGFDVRTLVVESTWPAMEAARWNSKITSSQAIGSLLGWIARGVPIVMADNHQRAGRFVSRLLFTAARRRWTEARSLVSATLDERVEV